MHDRIDRLRDLATIEAIIDRDPAIVSLESSVLQAIELMPTERAASGCVLVVDSDRVVGILTSKDIVRLTAKGRDLAQVRVETVMSAPVITLTLSPDLTVFKALSLLSADRIGQVPIVDAGEKLVGIVTATSLLASFDPLFDDAGKVVMLIPEGRKIAEAKRDEVVRQQAKLALQESQDSLSRITLALSHAVEGISHLDTQGRYMMVNQAYAKMVGYQPEDMVGLDWQTTVHPEDLQSVVAAYETMLATGKVEVEARGIRQDGSIFYKQLMMISDYDRHEQLTGHYCFMKDISDRKLAEAEIARQQQELQRSNEELQQFAYVASHDLQEPLRMITSYLELLEHRYKGQLDDRADKFIAYAVDGAARMQHLIQDLLSYSRLGTRSKPFTVVDCEEIVKNTLANLRVAIAESDAVITIDRLPQVTGDAIQLTQVFQNLIGNAIKFRRADNPPQIQIGVQQDRGDWLFSIRDNGIGIDSKYIDRIFVIFQRLHSRTDYSGTGIGLAVCKKIVERHGGKIWVESALNCGSTFYFTIPERSRGD